MTNATGICVPYHMFVMPWDCIKSRFIYLWCRISSWHWQLPASSLGQGSQRDCCRSVRLPHMPRRAVPIPGHSDGQRNKIIEQKLSLSFITPEQGWGAVQFLCCAISQQISVHEAPLCVLLGLEMLYSSSKLTFVLMLSAWCVFRVWLRLTVYHSRSYWVRVC